MNEDIAYENRYQMARLALASRRAAEGWRFRHLKSWEGRMLSMAWSTVKGLVRRRPGIAHPRERLAY